MIVSTGGANMPEVQRAYDTILALNPQLILLQCTASYPAEPEHMNLRVISTYRNCFPEAVVGLSDHQNGIAMAVISYVLGGRVVEKHFTLNHAAKGTDHAFSLEPTGMRKLVRDLQRARVALGDGIKRTYPEEINPLYKMGKKLVAARDLPLGHVLTRDDVDIKSPNDGLPPYEMDNVLGKALRRPLSADDNLRLEDLSEAA
jgi:N-acetylneuraminate synthase/sialic acid synthase